VAWRANGGNIAPLPRTTGVLACYTYQKKRGGARQRRKRKIGRAKHRANAAANFAHASRRAYRIANIACARKRGITADAACFCYLRKISGRQTAATAIKRQSSRINLRRGGFAATWHYQRLYRTLRHHLSLRHSTRAVRNVALCAAILRFAAVAALTSYVLCAA